MRKNFVFSFGALVLATGFMLGSPVRAAEAPAAPTTPVTTPAPSGKKFRRALVVAGGGISPAVVLGMIGGARRAGWNPDVVLTTCGSSLGAIISNSFPDQAEGLEFAKGSNFRNLLGQVQIETSSLIRLMGRMNELQGVEAIPEIFYDTLLHVPQNLRFLPATQFNTTGPTRFIVFGSRANFGPDDAGVPGLKPSFTQTYFTDTDTAEALRGMPSPVHALFPNGNVEAETQVLTGIRPEDAARAGVSDPILLNPAVINGDYYFTGAVDLYPVETATTLADDVLITYPAAEFKDYEDRVIRTSFGFNQSARMKKAIKARNVKWIDISGIEEVDFDPKPFVFLLRMQNKIPRDPEKFARGIQNQYDFGYSRVQEALEAADGENNVRWHLRNPLDD